LIVSITLENGLTKQVYTSIHSSRDMGKTVIVFEECTMKYLDTTILHLIILLVVLSCECEQAGIVKKEHIKIHGF